MFIRLMLVWGRDEADRMTRPFPLEEAESSWLRAFCTKQPDGPRRDMLFQRLHERGIDPAGDRAGSCGPDMRQGWGRASEPSQRKRNNGKK